MAYYPKTDEDWERLAECIVTRHPSVSPELVGGFTVDATQTIFTWYKGEERRKALDKRQYARDRLIELAKEAGCMPKVEPTPEELAPYRSPYRGRAWNWATGEIYEPMIDYPSPPYAMSSTKSYIETELREDYLRGYPLDPRGFQIKVVSREGTEVPGYDEWYKPSWMAEATSRLFPKTYGDWTSLAIDIKEKDPSIAVPVNEALDNILNERTFAEQYKRWLVDKATELGIMI